MTDFSECRIEGCIGDASRGRGGSGGLCCGHYMRKRRHGDPLAGRTAIGEIDKWIERLIKSDPSECTLWPFAKNEQGYGHIRRKGFDMLASRYICIEAHGEPEVPELDAAHSCGMGHTGCVTPSHLSWKTRLENATDKFIHGTVLSGERSPLAKLTELEAREILESTESNKSLSERFGVNAGHIWQIKTGRRWKCLQAA